MHAWLGRLCFVKTWYLYTIIQTHQLHVLLKELETSQNKSVGLRFANLISSYMNFQLLFACSFQFSGSCSKHSRSLLHVFHFFAQDVLALSTLPRTTSAAVNLLLHRTTPGAPHFVVYSNKTRISYNSTIALRSHSKESASQSETTFFSWRKPKRLHSQIWYFVCSFPDYNRALA